jgi:hypothetical protein
MASTEQGRVLEERWRPVFRHSAGRLGSHYLTALRTERRLLGWKTSEPPRLSLPPKNFGADGEWVAVGPGAELLSYAPPQWVADSGEPLLRDFMAARVRVDGAEAPIFARVKVDGSTAELKRGTRLAACFAGEQDPSRAVPDFWFEPVAEAGVGVAG